MQSRFIDLRSDTVTRPSNAMRKAMVEAEVGDDVFGEDPTVNALEAECAALFGKEAAVFVSSGTMANQIALKVHTRPGDDVVAHSSAHIARAEGNAGSVISGVQFRPVGNPDGTIDPAQVEAVFSTGDDPHYAPTRLICVENTHNAAGGRVVSLERIEALAAFARERGVGLHLDGARVLNACIALDIQAERMAAPFDSVTLCFSKGLGAPVGSIIAGSGEFIRACRRYRKMFGGGTRQAGILAAAARYALQNNVQRLAEDHVHARRVAQGLVETGHIALPRGEPESNLVFFSSTHPRVSQDRLVAGLKERGILVGRNKGGVSRAVTHLDVTAEGIESVLEAAREVLAG